MNELMKENQGKIFIVVGFLVIISAWGNFDNTLWHWLDAVITIGTVVGVWYNYSENKKQREIALKKIPIIFNVDGEKYKLKVDIPRKEFTRSEIQGILSNYSTDSKERYNINYLSQTDYSNQMFEIQNNERHELVLELLKEEFDGTKKDKTKGREYVGFDKAKMEKI